MVHPAGRESESLPPPPPPPEPPATPRRWWPRSSTLRCKAFAAPATATAGKTMGSVRDIRPRPRATNGGPWSHHLWSHHLWSHYPRPLSSPPSSPRGGTLSRTAPAPAPAPARGVRKGVYRFCRDLLGTRAPTPTRCHPLFPLFLPQALSVAGSGNGGTGPPGRRPQLHALHALQLLATLTQVTSHRWSHLATLTQAIALGAIVLAAIAPALRAPRLTPGAPRPCGKREI